MGRDRLLRACAVGLGIAALTTLARPLSAQNPAQILDSLRSRYRLPLLPATEVAATASRLVPGHTTASQSAFGANFGDGFVGAGYTSRTRSGKPSDGSAVIGFGLLNSRDYVGLEVSVFSFSTIREGFMSNGALGLKLHRAFPRNISVAVGGENIGHWGHSDVPNTYYGVISKVWRLRQREGDPFGSLTGNFGIGNGRFSRDFDTLSTSNSGNIGVFGSVGLRVHEAASLIADWGGQDLSLAVSIVPLRWVPLVITPGIADVLGRPTGRGSGPGVQNTHHHRAFVLGIGLGFKFSQVRNIFMPEGR
ncbi:MAG TPA: hypothetical protein VJU87_02115 [Gemmatimonadaceae bacterium]|nr:hypothetical protein [Gemmatimonadaceae bacterium]